MTHRRPRAVIFIPSLGEGGVDRMLVNIAGGLAGRGIGVDFVYAGGSRCRAMAAAMASILQAPPDAEFLRQGAERFTLEKATAAYIEALDLVAPDGGMSIA